ncbi:MAG: O-antigen ligase family protein [Actinobacteria bacterium]|nr:MAG: O-antigen ligase family protein [Actinomycetota bacterium]
MARKNTNKRAIDGRRGLEHWNAAALLAAGGGAANRFGGRSAAFPLAAAGAGLLVILTTLPWRVLFVLLALAATVNRYRFGVGSTATLQVAHIILVPFALRVFLMTTEDTRNRWRWAEWAILAFFGVNVASSVLFAVNRTQSILTAGLLGLAIMAYLATYTGLGTRFRLIFACRTVLVMATAAAALGLLSLVGFFLLHSHFGISRTDKAGPSVAGVAYEHNIFGSFAAAAAVAFLVLLRERNPLFSRRFCVVGFWICFLAMLASLTRSAWIGFAIAAVAAVWLHGPRLRRMSRVPQIAMTSLAVGALVVALLAFAGSTAGTILKNGVGSTITQIVNFGSGTGADRVSEWRLALQDLPKDPLIGLGTNSYGQRHLAPKKSPKLPLAQRVAYLGNLYVRTLYDTGILGFLLLLTFVVAILWPGLALRRAPGDLAPVARAFVFGYVVLAIAFAGTDASWQAWPWIFIGVARAASSLARRQLVESLVQRRAPTGGLRLAPLARVGSPPLVGA